MSQIWTHPDIAPAVTSLIAVVTRSGRKTSCSEAPEQKKAESTLMEVDEPRVHCGQPEQLVPDVLTDSDEDADSIGEGMEDLCTEDEEADATDSEVAVDAGRGQTPREEPDVPSS